MNDRDELAELLHLSRNGGGSWVGEMDDDFDFIDAINEADFVMSSDWLARVKAEAFDECRQAVFDINGGNDWLGRTCQTRTTKPRRTKDMTTGSELIAVERERQITVEGYSALDDAGKAHQLVDAAACYLRAGTQKPGTVPVGWPWVGRYWKPSSDPVRNLTKAGALIAAAIDSITAGEDLLAKLYSSNESREG